MLRSAPASTETEQTATDQDGPESNAKAGQLRMFSRAHRRHYVERMALTAIVAIFFFYESVLDSLFNIFACQVRVGRGRLRRWRPAGGNRL